ncbi:DNA primase [Jannaschia sp. M317]|uniref:DNA primase n=1 Tax=Jannaschia sp. M317 TaxID=2867011 RepID=UPI0021A4C9CF|nr:DNA primase [Jannaschia sp. M317]UWQ17499.1 DNA primase [Jannaschia sp. M317]
MRLPDSFLDDLRSRLSLSQVVGRKVVWDMRKTNQAKGDWWAPCPFHQEKSASFHVDDQKGFYYCFGCQAKGNLFGFVQETENVGFLEAVEILAREAGMPMPARDPKAAEKSDRRTQLAQVTEAATQWFRLQLNTGAAAEARAYLDRRGLRQRTLDTFEIGFAPRSWEALTEALTAKGVAFDLLEATGLAGTNDRGKRFDKFRNRIIFPIRDVRGRVIGFGGRAMDPDDKAKYLNSSETELFDKGANLYNLRAARAAAGKGKSFVVAEGYMDVIALHQAGFEAAVAPLGTAVTERQLQMMWRVTPEPLIALDGDAAGQKAGLRVADLALPLIEAGQSLRFAILPEGQDPDDLIRGEGREAMQAVLDGARPMLSLMWDRAVEGRSFDSPERRAMLDRDLRDLVRKIRDPALRRHYAEEIARLRADLFGLANPVQQAPPPARPERPWTPRPPGRGRWQPPAGAAEATRASALVRGTLTAEDKLEQVALAGLALHPSLVNDFADALETLTWARTEHQQVATALLRLPDRCDAQVAQEQLLAFLGEDTLETLLAQSHVRISPAARAGADRETARLCIRDILTRLEARRGADRERREALEDFEEDADEAMTWRLAQATRRKEAAQRARQDSEGTADEASHADHYDSLLATPKGSNSRKK